MHGFPCLLVLCSCTQLMCTMRFVESICNSSVRGPLTQSNKDPVFLWLGHPKAAFVQPWILQCPVHHNSSFISQQIWLYLPPPFPTTPSVFVVVNNCNHMGLRMLILMVRKTGVRDDSVQTALHMKTFLLLNAERFGTQRKVIAGNLPSWFVSVKVLSKLSSE